MGPCSRGTANQSEEKPLNMLESYTLGFFQVDNSSEATFGHIFTEVTYVKLGPRIN